LVRRGIIDDNSGVPDALDIAALPDDPATLRALLIEVLAERDNACAARDALEAQNDRLRHILLKLDSSRNPLATMIAG
jgi:hypothetical protein